MRICVLGIKGSAMKRGLVLTKYPPYQQKKKPMDTCAVISALSHAKRKKSFVIVTSPTLVVTTMSAIALEVEQLNTVVAYFFVHEPSPSLSPIKRI
ncbi:unnamed protein product [Vicia faba]|uniref:Uncharacterized protein n=1 Tax=Vicia faba TaxID=3906 RepID=A0AAV1ARY3_VICFA|nr:unnamed protein product [Vicia faba]